MGPRSRNMTVAVTAALYATSLGLPTVAPFSPQLFVTVYPGWWAFRSAWQGLVAFELREPNWWVLAGAWVANPLVWVAGAATLAGRRGAAAGSAWVGVALCLMALFRISRLHRRPSGVLVLARRGDTACGRYLPAVGRPDTEPYSVAGRTHIWTLKSSRALRISRLDSLRFCG